MASFIFRKRPTFSGGWSRAGLEGVAGRQLDNSGLANAVFSTFRNDEKVLNYSKKLKLITSQTNTNKLKGFDAMLFLLIRRPTSPT